MNHDQGAFNWHKSSYSSQGGQCVEQGVMADTGAAAVRDTKEEGTGGVLKFDPHAWSTFVGSLR